MMHLKFYFKYQKLSKPIRECLITNTTNRFDNLDSYSFFDEACVMKLKQKLIVQKCCLPVNPKQLTKLNVMIVLKQSGDAW